MLSRLAEIREASGADVVEEKPADAPKPPPTEAELDIEWLEMVEEMRELFKEILEDEGTCIQSFAEVKDRVLSMEEIVQLEREALLPTKLSQLANRFESQELVCQRMIRRAKNNLTTLKADDQDIDEDDVALGALRPVRTSISKVRALEFKGLVQGFFAARSHNRQEMIARAARQLRFAYPDALEEELADIMEFPELAFVAISRRLEKGPEVTLDGILGEMEGKKADAQKLEQGAKELKLMFLQFAELIDTQGDNLNSIEANIKATLEETSEAIGILQDAEAEKRAYERKKLKFYLIAAFLFFYFVVYPLTPKGEGKFFAHGFEDSVVDLENMCKYTYRQAILTVAPAKYKEWYGTEMPGDVWKEEPAAAPQEAAGPAAAPAKPAAAPAAAPKKASLAEVTKRMSPRRFYRQQLQEQEQHQLKPDSPPAKASRTPLQGFIAPRTPLAENPVLRSVALTARAGAALRKPRRANKEDNGTETSR